MVDAGQPAGCACEGAAKHCLVVVRETLLMLAFERFMGKWSGIATISPDDDSRTRVIEAVLS